MKTLKLALFLTVFIAVNFSCQKEIDSYDISNIENILHEFNADKTFVGDHAIYKKGKIELGYTNGHVVAFVDDLSLDIPISYYLQTDNNLKKMKDKTFEEGEIIFFKNSLIINSLLTNESFVFTIENNYILPDYLTSKNTTIHKGYSLGQDGSLYQRVIDFKKGQGVKNTFVLPLPGEGFGKPPFVSCGCRTNSGAYLPGGCSSGGRGATDCSFSNSSGSCSVSCGSGYHACCNS